MQVQHTEVQQVTATQHDLPGGWALELDPEAPEGFRVYRPDGRFFTVTFNTTRFGQPVVTEQPDETGVTGYVIAVVQKVGNEWRVLVTRNERVANDFTEPLVEGSRHSVTNANPFLSVSGHPFVVLSQGNHTNSARIQDNIVFGVIIDHGGTFPVPQGAFTMSFNEFFQTSTDTLTKAVLGEFVIRILGAV